MRNNGNLRIAKSLKPLKLAQLEGEKQSRMRQDSKKKFT
jgi:hypothetical protein